MIMTKAGSNFQVKASQEQVDFQGRVGVSLFLQNNTYRV